MSVYYIAIINAGMGLMIAIAHTIVRVCIFMKCTTFHFCPPSIFRHETPLWLWQLPLTLHCRCLVGFNSSYKLRHLPDFASFDIQKFLVTIGSVAMMIIFLISIPRLKRLYHLLSIVSSVGECKCYSYSLQKSKNHWYNFKRSKRLSGVVQLEKLWWSLFLLWKIVCVARAAINLTTDFTNISSFGTSHEWYGNKPLTTNADKSDCLSHFTFSIFATVQLSTVLTARNNTQRHRDFIICFPYRIIHVKLTEVSVLLKYEICHVLKM